MEKPALFSGKAAPKSRKARRPCSAPTTTEEAVLPPTLQHSKASVMCT